VDQLIRIGVDTSKRFFQLHGVDQAERPVLHKKLTRHQFGAFFQRLPPSVVAMEACGGAHHWARELTRMGQTVKLIAPQLAKPYVKRGKNDAADAAALCEAASRPSMRFVPIKTVDQQAALMLAGERERLVRQRTRLVNTIRGYAAEFGLIAAKGTAQIEPLLQRLRDDKAVPELARELFADQAEDYARLQMRIAAIEARLTEWHKSNEMARRLTAIPGVGRVVASLLVMKTPDPGAFRCGRDYAAWLGLTPKDHSTAGKVRLGGITRAGDEMMRSLLVVGATAVVWQTRRGATRRPMPWLLTLMARKPAKLAAVALANKIARVAWKLMTSGETYNAALARPAVAAPSAA
jgi:transposase